ncbi:MAG: glycerol-3-phosphate 1-O-acyltransferase PlsY [Desulfovibrio sp.]|nr:glycerol-3-phosphate 1-O-acyltransferase PlsY [Desulfovibrio sp.]
MGSSLLLVLGSYLLGSVPWGLVIAKQACGVDPRLSGSCSIGATNVARLCGFGYGVATLACDLLKGALPVYLALHMGLDVYWTSFVAFAAVAGHVFPCFTRFRGGKAVATSIGVFLPLAFFPLLASCSLCLFLIWLSGFVSVGSLTLVVSLPVFLAFSGHNDWLILSICLALLVLMRHRENIRRLHDGTEKSWIKSRHRAEENASESGVEEKKVH